jgi:excisionase family DNA binding protein
MENLYKPREAAAILGVSYETVLDWIGQRTLPATRLPSGHYRIDEYDLDAVLVPVGRTRPRRKGSPPRLGQPKRPKRTEQPHQQPPTSPRSVVRSFGKAKNPCRPFGTKARRVAPKANEKKAD